jgi:hypothetical protein
VEQDPFREEAERMDFSALEEGLKRLPGEISRRSTEAQMLDAYSNNNYSLEAEQSMTNQAEVLFAEVRHLEALQDRIGALRQGPCRVLRPGPGVSLGPPPLPCTLRRAAPPASRLGEVGFRVVFSLSGNPERRPIPGTRLAKVARRSQGGGTLRARTAFVVEAFLAPPHTSSQQELGEDGEYTEADYENLHAPGLNRILEDVVARFPGVVPEAEQLVEQGVEAARGLMDLAAPFLRGLQRGGRGNSDED